MHIIEKIQHRLELIRNQRDEISKRLVTTNKSDEEPRRRNPEKQETQKFRPASEQVGKDRNGDLEAHRFQQNLSLELFNPNHPPSDNAQQRYLDRIHDYPKPNFCDSSAEFPSKPLIGSAVVIPKKQELCSFAKNSPKKNDPQSKSQTQRTVMRKHRREEETKLAQRLFGILASTLCQAKKTHDRENGVSKRVEIENKVGDKEREFAKELQRTAREQRDKQAEEEKHLKEHLITEEKLLRMKIDFVIEVQREKHLARFLRTKSTVHILWMPRILDESFDAALRKRKIEFNQWRKLRTQKYKADCTAYLMFRKRKHEEYRNN